MLDPLVQKWVVLGVTLAIIVGLYLEKFKPAVVFLVGVFVLMLLKIVDTQHFLDSFANKSLISIFILVLITNTINDNFNVTYWFDKVFSGAKSPRVFLAKMTFSVAALSSFMNNTPIVALMIPYVRGWAKSNKVSPSKLLIPLSFAASLGGMITVIGTSTNLVLLGFLEDNHEPLLGFWDFLPLGVLVTVVGIIFIVTAGYNILPNRIAPTSDVKENRRQYLVETYISPKSRFIGKTVQQAELRNLDGVYLAQIIRNGKMIAPISPEEEILEGDRLFFAGETDKVVDFVKNDSGIHLSSQEKFDLGRNLEVVEAVVPANSMLAGKTVKEYKFREKFDAAIIGIHRNGEKIFGKIGDVVLKNGDLLLLTVGKNFSSNTAVDKNLYIVSNVSTISQDNPLQKRSFIVILGLILTLLFFGFFDLFMSLMIIMMALMALKLTSFTHVRRDGGNMVLFVILASALTLGKALIESGAAEMMANFMISIFQPMGIPFLMLGVFLLTLVLTSFITNVAAVSIAFPIVFAIVKDLGIDGTPFYLCIAFAASASFLTPISYQTNLMVYGPGGYKFRDFFKIGFPLTILYATVTVTYLYFVYL